jgi:penicillin-binding protein 1C
VKKRLKQVFRIISIGFILYLLFPISKPLMNMDYSLVVKDEKGKMLRVFLNGNQQWCLPPEDSVRIPVKLKSAVLCFEDNYFRWHPGVNMVSICRAVYQNVTHRHIVSGASTITMQVARLRNRDKRTWGNKVVEMFLAFKMELHYSKRTILKLYLDHAPYGSNIIGYRAASERYFRKQPQQLSWAEAALLAVLPNAPTMVSPLANRDELKSKRNRLLNRMFQKKDFDKATLDLALLEPVPSHEYPFEIVAAHLTQRIENRKNDNKIVVTTIDYRLQRHLEALLKQYISSLSHQGIHNASALIVETQTGKVKAYLGSQDFFDDKGEGQVDGIVAHRSSGSILKPFLYALSMDDGLIIPQTLMKDVPTYFDAFSPNNADEKFNGIIPAKEALIRSLNIPAVRLLNMFGVSRFYSFLVNAGVSTLFRQPEDYGLPLIIGGAEVNVWDMAMLYRGLASKGKFAPLHYLLNDSTRERNESHQLISSGACFLTLDMLRELKRPGAEFYWEQYQDQKPIAWKTGTSYGHKDAWAVGTSPQWTIAVWVGNFNGETNLNLAGAVSAGPLLFDIFNYLPHDAHLRWFEKTEMDFRNATICEETGFLAGPYCDHKKITDVPIFMLPLRLCPFHQNIFMDKDNKYSVCSYCWKPGYQEKNILAYPADVTYYLRQRGQLVDDVPEHDPSCTKIAGASPFQIIYPTDSAYLGIPRDFDGKFQKIIAKVAHNHPSKKVLWYLDDQYLGSTILKHNMALKAKYGWHQLLAVDENGYEEKVRFFVRQVM